ncbi:hypothetical protein QBC33DRAFT_603263 [Phialemonium atrogriseum]|uniref:Uncharacterized protein n=1 Tax=Phialemonium atrogriseum TaxID=1093897 RepID=A0AAJ0C571_9PEZI|nr:uncharacterized protein QBC33DRAFT_603263 [Phialemonium atrogriseum]KAK1770161.1 hypothetical protein QBC33DRAFT_603263 [Phialemonium atrogriseum]
MPSPRIRHRQWPRRHRWQNLKRVLPKKGFTYPPGFSVFANSRESIVVIKAMWAATPAVREFRHVYSAEVDTMLGEIFDQAWTCRQVVHHMDARRFWTMIMGLVSWSCNNKFMRADLLEKLADYLVLSRLRYLREPRGSAVSPLGQTAIAVDRWLGFLQENHPDRVPRLDKDVRYDDNSNHNGGDAMEFDDGKASGSRANHEVPPSVPAAGFTFTLPIGAPRFPRGGHAEKRQKVGREGQSASVTTGVEEKAEEEEEDLVHMTRDLTLGR